jgi:hypothetical protein
VRACQLDGSLRGVCGLYQKRKKLKNRKLHVTFCGFFFLRFFLHLMNERGYREAASSTLNQGNTKGTISATLDTKSATLI